MARTKRWKTELNNAVAQVELSSWKYFNDFVYQEMLDFRQYVWRGHRRDDWLLEPTLTRATRSIPADRKPRAKAEHLQNFKMAVRGRRGANPSRIETDNDWWALGQHYGLYTPLLDWSSSPFVGAYFAFINEGTPQSKNRPLFAVHPHTLIAYSKYLIAAAPPGLEPEVVEVVRPLTDDNPRLVNQGGLFLRILDDVDLESWVRTNNDGTEGATLIKINIPNKDRALALRSLNRMNINHLSLFPDLTGASLFCNTDLSIKDY